MMQAVQLRNADNVSNITNILLRSEMRDSDNQNRHQASKCQSLQRIFPILHLKPIENLASILMAIIYSRIPIDDLKTQT